jgi:hypothetical protein
MESPNSLWYHVISVHSLWVCESPWVFTEVMHKSPCHPFATRAGRIQGNLVNRCEKCEEVRSKLCPIFPSPWKQFANAKSTARTNMAKLWLTMYHILANDSHNDLNTL